jgi:hypothetical protein
MPEFIHQTTIPVSAHELGLWHERPGAFVRLAPTWERMSVVKQNGGIRDGDELHFCIHKGPMCVNWVARHSDYLAGRQFRDTMVRGPFARWTHLHQWEEVGPTNALLIDTVHWQLPLHPLSVVARPFVYSMLQRMFMQRHARTRNDLAAHGRYTLAKQRIAISGGTGMIGRALTAFLQGGGHEVHVLSRRAGEGTTPTIVWDPDIGQLDPAALEGFDAVIHLAGAGIADKPWTDERRREILDSRVRGTSLLARTIAQLKSPPGTFISASAVGYYGHTEDYHVDESSPAGEGFLASVCEQWEAAAQPARDAGIRVVHPRIGVVLAAAGGALARMLLPFRMGVGGRIGPGTQGFPWIALDDVVYGMLHLLATPELSGPVNLVGPAPMSNAEFTRALGRALYRPTVLPVPGLAIRTLFGDMGNEALLQGAYVDARRLRETGFLWCHRTVEEAVRFELGLKR